jgi:AcrR family transcriptional regulator
MPRTEESNERIREEQRSKILEAAKRVFAIKGPAATMDDVAAEAGVSHGLAYRYFDSKQAILRALVEQAIRTPAAELERIQDTSRTPGERLEAFIEQFVESRRHHPELFQLLDQVLLADAMPEDFRVLIHERGKALQWLLRQLIVEGQKTGEVAADDPDQLVRAIFAAMDGMTRWAARNPHDEHFPDARIFIRMLKP